MAQTDPVQTSNITFDDYWHNFVQQHYEWDGERMIALPAIYRRHDNIRQYLEALLNSYFEVRPIGKVQAEPFPMRFELDGKAKVRLPDLQVSFAADLNALAADATHGPADIAIEIVSTDSTERDYRLKFDEYQAIGVQEYWIIDPEMHRAEFNVLDTDGMYQRSKIDPDGFYRSPLLPNLAIHVPTLWRDPLPGPRDIIRFVDDQLGSG